MFSCFISVTAINTPAPLGKQEENEPCEKMDSYPTGVLTTKTQRPQRRGAVTSLCLCVFVVNSCLSALSSRHRIKLRRAARWNVTRQQGDSHDQRRHGDERKWIHHADVEEQALQKACQSQRAG